MTMQRFFRGTPALCPRANSRSFYAIEADASAQLIDDGWTWPIQVIEAGWADGTVDGTEPGTPQYINVEAVAQVAAACQSARFGRRSPRWPSEECDPGRIAGIISEGRFEDGRALATLRLSPEENEIRAKLIAAQKAGVLHLFGVSVCALFEMEARKLESQLVMEVTSLNRLISVDFVVEAAAGGKILPYAGYRAAASGYLPPEIDTVIAAAKEAEAAIAGMCADALYLAAIQLTLATAEMIQAQTRNEAAEKTQPRPELLW